MKMMFFLLLEMVLNNTMVEKLISDMNGILVEHMVALSAWISPYLLEAFFLVH